MNTYVVFRVGESWYGVPVLDAQAIEEAKPVDKIPKSPVHVEGIYSFRDQFCAVINTGILFGQDPTQLHPPSRFILMEKDGKPLAFFVDEVQTIVEWEEHKIQSLMVPLAGGGLQKVSVYHDEERAVVLLSLVTALELYQSQV
ncbi:chemotaxis protein CheW [Cytobacillus sp. FJAT-54145]|uniref:Chemotaxis protein CheW n=1 Tax=Cytobacillus spartinae TaxID=3299023 RepID=A0ABW6KA76_9BACI